MNASHAVALVASVVVAWQTYGLVIASKEPDLRNAVNVLAGASATLLGFLVSAGALLYAVAQTRTVRNFQRTGHFHNLLTDLFVDSASFLAALIAGLVCLFLAGSSSVPGPTELQRGMVALIATNTLAYLLLIPVGWKMWLLLSSIRPESNVME